MPADPLSFKGFIAWAFAGIALGVGLAIANGVVALIVTVVTHAR